MKGRKGRKGRKEEGKKERKKEKKKERKKERKKKERKKRVHLYIYYPPSTFDDAHTYTNSRDSNTCENSYVHAAPPPAFFSKAKHTHL